MQEQATRFGTRTRRLLLALLALVFVSLQLARVYPPSLTGAWSCPDTSTSSAITLTLRPLGRGYLKISAIPEQALRWQADGDKINLFPENPAVIGQAFMNPTPSRIVVTHSHQDQSIAFDLGNNVIIQLRRGVTAP